MSHSFKIAVRHKHSCSSEQHSSIAGGALTYASLGVLSSNSRKAAFVTSSSKGSGLNPKWQAFSLSQVGRDNSFSGSELCTICFDCTIAGLSCQPRFLSYNSTCTFPRKITVFAFSEGGSSSYEGVPDYVQILERRPQISANGDVELPGLHSARREGTSEASLDWRQLVSEREAAKAIVYKFLRSRGLSPKSTARTVNKASLFIAHLLSLLHSQLGDQYITGHGIPTEAIRSTIRPYLRTLAAKYGKGLGDFLVRFPSVPHSSAPRELFFNIKTTELGQDKVSRLNLANFPNIVGLVVGRKLPPSVVYLLGIGMSPEQVEQVLIRSPLIAGYNVENKIKPVVEYVIELGVSPSSIPIIVRKRPTLFGCSVEENLRPTTLFLEGFGVEKDRWPRIMVAFPHILTYSHTKLQDIVNFLLVEVGFSSSNVGRVITRFPHVVGYSLEAKLRPLMAYFRSIGIVDVSVMVMRCPQTLGLSLEGNIKTTVGFLVELGFTIEEVAIMINRFPQILGLSVDINLAQKWEFFILMGRSKSELVDFPQYFGYSLQKRIQPRHQILVQQELSWTLSRMLSATDRLFEIYLRKSATGKLNTNID